MRADEVPGWYGPGRYSPVVVDHQRGASSFGRSGPREMERYAEGSGNDSAVLGCLGGLSHGGTTPLNSRRSLPCRYDRSGTASKRSWYGAGTLHDGDEFDEPLRRVSVPHGLDGGDPVGQRPDPINQLRQAGRRRLRFDQTMLGQQPGAPCQQLVGIGQRQPRLTFRTQQHNGPDHQAAAQ